MRGSLTLVPIHISACTFALAIATMRQERAKTGTAMQIDGNAAFSPARVWSAVEPLVCKE
jgi:hypothetical protein